MDVVDESNPVTFNATHDFVAACLTVEEYTSRVSEFLSQNEVVMIEKQVLFSKHGRFRHSLFTTRGEREGRKIIAEESITQLLAPVTNGRSKGGGRNNGGKGNSETELVSSWIKASDPKIS